MVLYGVYIEVGYYFLKTVYQEDEIQKIVQIVVLFIM